MSEIIETRIIPVREMFFNEDSSYGIYACHPVEFDKVKLNTYNNISVKGNTVKLRLDQEYNARLIEKEDKKYGVFYEIASIFEDIPTDISKQRDYLANIITKNQVDAIFTAYPNHDVIDLIKNDQIDLGKVKGIGKKSYSKIKDKIIQNLEFQQAYEFLSKFEVTNNLIIKLVKHFKSAGLLIRKMNDNPYCITEVNGIGFLKADKIALNMGCDPNSGFRIISAIEYVVEEDSKNGNTYSKEEQLLTQVHELTDIERDLIQNQIKTTERIIVIGDRIALKKNYNAEKFISKKLKEIMNCQSELDFDVQQFIAKQEEKRNIKLTDQQKQFFYNIKKNNVNLLVGYAGCGKSQMTALLIDLLEELNISYKLTSPTGKAAKVLSNYTNRNAETLHRATGLGKDHQEGFERFIDEEFVIVDEFSMVDVILCSRTLSKLTNENVRLLFIGDDFQLPSVSAGNLLYDMIHSEIIPTTKLDVVFRQSEGGILDIATKVRQNQKFLSNDDWGILEFGNNCIIACVPQDKINGGYQYYYNKLLETYSSDDITIATPTKKSELGTVIINKHIQDIVNPQSDNKPEKETGFDKITFRVGDSVLNTKNTYDIFDVDERKIDIVNGDIGKIIQINLEEKELIVDFEFAKVPFGFDQLNQLLHCWAMTIHKLQGSSNNAIVVIADKAHKFQLNANLLYTAITRGIDKVIILSQAETINFAMRKVASQQRDTFLKEMLVEEGVE
ncbi:AAA family ATPase [Robertmurraya siralis]|uniref:AAA family ATPase n=1 Tax=Robertmurraya siralis TaxID=77777 RepID=UPI0010F7B269|nr:AAA family ATPase [Robertmurraya siralis]